MKENNQGNTEQFTLDDKNISKNGKGSNNGKIEKIIGTAIGIIIVSILVVMTLKPFVNSMNEEKKDNETIPIENQTNTNKYKFDMGFNITSWDGVNLMQENLLLLIIDKTSSFIDISEFSIKFFLKII